MHHLSTQMNPQAKGTVSGETLPNPKNYDHCMKIVARSGRLLDNNNVVPKKVMSDEVDDGVMKPSAPIPLVVDVEENVCVEEKKDDPPSVMVDIERNKGVKSSKNDVPKCPPPYPQRLMKKKEENQFKKFVDLFSKLCVNIPLVDPLLQMLGYQKFMKELLKKTRVVGVGTIEVSHHCSIVMESNLSRRERIREP